MTQRIAVLAGVAAVVISMWSCSDGGPVPDRDVERDTADKREVSTLPKAQGIDVRHPERLAVIPPAVVAVAVPTRAAPGERITTTFRTTPDASCQLVVSYESEEEPTRLPPAVADRTGVVSWTWAARKDAAAAAIAHVVCSGGEQGTFEIALR